VVVRCLWFPQPVSLSVLTHDGYAHTDTTVYSSIDSIAPPATLIYPPTFMRSTGLMRTVNRQYEHR